MKTEETTATKQREDPKQIAEREVKDLIAKSRHPLSILQNMYLTERLTAMFVERQNLLDLIWRLKQAWSAETGGEDVSNESLYDEAERIGVPKAT